ncbi:MAG: LysM peptidoglycan-binding domain-containing protein [Bacteroidota bacterium]
MNDKLMNIPNPDDDAIAKKLTPVAEQTQPSDRFAAALEQKLYSAPRPRAGWFSLRLPQMVPALGLLAFMVVLALVLSWSFKNLVPRPQPAINHTPVTPVAMTNTPEPAVTPGMDATPVPQKGGFDFRGGKLFLPQPLPEAGAKAHVYLLNKDAPASREQAQALADRFGIQGEMYTEPNYVFNTTNFVISDGKQKLSVYSDRYFSYTADMAKNRVTANGLKNDNAEAKIHEFLQARGMDFPFAVQASDFTGGYSVRPLAPDSIPMQYESFTWPPMRVTLDENGDVLNIDATLLSLDPAPAGEFDILSAQEAFDKMRDDNAQGGKMEFMHSAGQVRQEWYRSYPDDQTITIAGYLSKNPALDPGKAPLIMIDSVPVTGNTSGLEALDDYTFVKAAGQYVVENGIRQFKINTWDKNVNEAYMSGKMSRQGDRILITSDDGSGQQYPLIDPPADLPIDSQTENSQFGVSGLILNNEFSWSYIQYFENMSGGGGGGGGLGFYKLNLSGTPVPVPPTQVPQAQTGNNSLPLGEYIVEEGDTLTQIAQKLGTTVDELVKANGLTDTIIMVGQRLLVPPSATNFTAQSADQRMENVRGTLHVAIHNKGDGTSVKEYTLEVGMPGGGSALYTLEGTNLGELDAFNALPIEVTGTLKGNLIVEGYKIPYPDLHFQILRGTQKVEQAGGQNVVTFTTQDGTTYVETLATNTFPETQSFTGSPGDLIEQEVLILPDEKFGGLPVAHVYQSALVQQDGPAMQVQANVIHTYDDGNNPGGPVLPSTQPNLTIDKVELVYYVPNPYYQAASDPNYAGRSPYVQPAWHFVGHYDDGSAFDMLVQALKQESLLPEISPGLSPG